MSNRAARLATAMEASLISVLALGLYLPFLALQYDSNGIAEAAALEAGQVVNKNHILYRPIGLLIYRAVQQFGYHDRSLLVLQTMNAFCGALGIGLGYAGFKWAARDKPAALFGSAWLATSFAYWLFSTDAAYVIMAAAFILAAMVCAVYGQSGKAAAAAAVSASLAVLTWQASVFVIPWLVAVLVI